MRVVACRVLVVISLLALPSTVQAQTIAGTVRDATGAVMPGVTVEAASPALIEKVRTATTDGAGQYKIVESPVRHLHGHLLAAGFQHGETRGHRAERRTSRPP